MDDEKAKIDDVSWRVFGFEVFKNVLVTFWFGRLRSDSAVWIGSTQISLPIQPNSHLVIDSWAFRWTRKKVWTSSFSQTVDRQASLESPPIVSHLSLNETSQSPFKPVETHVPPVTTPVKQALSTASTGNTPVKTNQEVESMEVDPQNVKRKLTNQVGVARRTFNPLPWQLSTRMDLYLTGNEHQTQRRYFGYSDHESNNCSRKSVPHQAQHESIGQNDESEYTWRQHSGQRSGLLRQL